MEGCGTFAGRRWRRIDSGTVADPVAWAPHVIWADQHMQVLLSRCVVADRGWTDAVAQKYHFAMVVYSIEAELVAVDGGGKWEEMW